ncbi:CapA family protein [Sinorhizobium meliloti]|uniref:CapA family protein n=1 Tax=Rhizobium meliloti TaxID=382 RepID=UPI003DA0DC90
MGTLIFEIRSFEGSPQAQHGCAYHISVPEPGSDLKAMGFNLMSGASNHTFDWGIEGMRETGRILVRAGSSGQVQAKILRKPAPLAFWRLDMVGS